MMKSTDPSPEVQTRQCQHVHDALNHCTFHKALCTQCYTSLFGDQPYFEQRTCSMTRFHMSRIA